MKNLFLAFFTAAISSALQAQVPSIEMVTTTSVDNEFSFRIAAAEHNSQIQVDFGNGALSGFAAGLDETTISGTLTGNTVKIYGDGIKFLNVGNKNLTMLNVSNDTLLSSLDCSSNQLTALDISNNLLLTELSCAGNQISELDISNDTLLTFLNCTENELSFLNVSNNSELIFLYCGRNQINSLNVSNNPKLTDLECSQNNISQLDVTDNVALKTLSCSKNQLTTIDLSNNTALTGFWCDMNQISELNVSNNLELRDLIISVNQISELVLSNNTKLTSLYCYANELNSLDISANPELTMLNCSGNNLSILDVSNNPELTLLVCEGNYLNFSTLPVGQSSWSTYLYSPQLTFEFPKVYYNTGETVDLSSQLTSNGNTTVYTWKNAQGNNLPAAENYSENNGVFTFYLPHDECIHCEMTNSTFPDLTLITSCLKIAGEPLAIKETTEELNAYPNPVKNQLSVCFNKEILRTAIYNTYGVRVSAMQGNGSAIMSFSVSELPKGLYFLKIYHRDGIVEHKFIKM